MLIILRGAPRGSLIRGQDQIRVGLHLVRLRTLRLVLRIAGRVGGSDAAE